MHDRRTSCSRELAHMLLPGHDEEVASCIAHKRLRIHYGAAVRRPVRIFLFPVADDCPDCELAVREADGANTVVPIITNEQLASRIQRQAVRMVEQCLVARTLLE